jgi:heptosyltransferase-1
MKDGIVGAVRLRVKFVRVAPTEEEIRVTVQGSNQRLQALDARRILIVKPSALGDVVQALPLVAALRQRFPDAWLAWLVQRELRELPESCPGLDAVLVCDRRPTWSQAATCLLDLRRQGFDLVLDLQGLLRSAVMTLATGARHRIGLETAREGSAWVTTASIPGTGRDVPAHARYWKVAEAFGVGDVTRQVTLSIPSQDGAIAEQFLSGLPRPIFAVQWGAKWETKRWPIEQFAALLSRAGRTWGGSAVLVGGTGDVAECDRMADLIRRDGSPIVVQNLAGRTTLRQLASLATRVDAMISNDSGPMHLAAELGTPTLGIFTCTSAVRSGPPSNRHEFVSTQVTCAASYRKVCPCPGDQRMACHRELDVERAWRGLMRLVDKNEIVRSCADAA